MKTGSLTTKGLYKGFPAFILFCISIVIPVQIITAQGENWRLVGNMPTPRHDVANCVVNGKIYIMGGMTNESGPGKAFYNLVSRFDPSTNEWEDLENLPESRVGAYACNINNRIYLFGGTKDFQSQNSAKVYIYDIENDKWTNGTDMPRGIAYAGGCVHENKIYLIGGLEVGTTTWAPTNAVMRYDPEENNWDTLANLNVANSFPTVCAANGKIYAFGGAKAPEGIIYDVVQEYDPLLNEWKNKNPIPTTLAFHSCISFNDRIWLMSGTTDVTSPINDSVYVYEPSTGKWSTTADEDVPSIDFWYPTLVRHDKTVYLLCGYDDYSTGSADVPEVIAFDFPVARVANNSALPDEPIQILFYEDGDIYVTPSGTQADIAAIESATIYQEAGAAGQVISLQIETPGSYWIYGIASDGRIDRGYSSVYFPTSNSPSALEDMPDFNLYPNPATEYLTVDLPIAGNISLLDQLGRKLTGISNVTDKTKLFVSGLPQGVYYLKVNYGQASRVKKVIVE
jgi:N-acetylneuraminic acid mutarotase